MENTISLSTGVIIVLSTLIGTGLPIAFVMIRHYLTDPLRIAHQNYIAVKKVQEKEQARLPVNS